MKLFFIFPIASGVSDVPGLVNNMNELNTKIPHEICTKLKPSGNREKDEELIFEKLCKAFANRGHQNISFTPYPDSSKIDNLKEHLILLIDNQEECDDVLEYIYEFLDNIYPHEELWRLKM